MKEKKFLFIFIIIFLIFIFLFSKIYSKTPNVLSNKIDNEHIPEPRSKIVQENEFSQKNKIHISSNFMAVTANPYATEAAYKILLSGGTAIDAALAAQMVLGLVEPQSSGLGGGGFMLYWDANSKKLSSYDGREKAPKNVDQSLFIRPANEKKQSFFDAVVGGKSVGVPGILKMLEYVHRKYGRLSWKELFLPAIDLSENGFVISERLGSLLTKVPKLKERTVMKEYFFNEDGAALEIGSIHTNPEYSNTLRALSELGSDYFYKGDLAKNIVNVVGNDKNLGYLTIKDLEEYDAKEREPICQFIFSYQMCGMPPPSSGGTSVLSILRILEYLSKDAFFNLNSKIEDNPLLAHLFIEASRLAFIDRNTFIADPDFVNVPIKNMLGKKYLESRAKLISKKKILTDLHPGKFFSNQTNPISAVSPEDASTSHLSIVDSYGNIVSLTSSIETAFGSRLMVDGFLLNNQLTDFSFNPIDTSGSLVSNRVEGNKRPRSSMSPMIIFNKDGKPLLVLGSPGGKRIIPYVAGLILDVLIMSRDAQDSLYRPHIFQVDDRAEVEVGTSKHIVEELRSIGHDPIIRDQTSGLHVIQYKDNKLIGLADPRREGTAKGG